MKNIATIILFGSAVLMTACSDSKEEAEESKEKESAQESKAPEVEPVEPVAEYTAVANEKMKIGVKGMTCAVGCKGAIEKKLANTPGVTKYEVAFDEENEIDETIVEFDNNYISGEEIIASIETLNDSAYSVQNVEKLKL